MADFGRIDYVYPIAGIGERVSIANKPSSTGFEMPDLTVLDVDLTGVLYTISLAVQQFRRQEPGKNGLRGQSKSIPAGKRAICADWSIVGCVASVCGFYCCPTLPIYTAAKHAVVGLVRSYGKYLPEEKITMNAICPNVIRTNISTGAFYDTLEEKNLLTPIEGVIETFEKLLGSDKTSGEIFEIGPHYKSEGAKPRKAAEYLDQESEKVFDMLYERGRPLHQPR